MNYNTSHNILDNLPGWSYQISNDESVTDDARRPPLLGKSLRVPQGLYDVPWSQVSDAYGKASLTPYYIEALSSDNDGDREFGIYGLYSATTHQGSVYESARLAIPFLVDMLEAEKEDTTILASHFIARIAVGENHFIHTPRDVAGSKSIYFNKVYACRDTLKAFYKATLSDEMQRLLCFFPDTLPDVLPLSTDNNERLAATLVAQGFIAAERKCTAHVAEVKQLMYESPSLLVRGGAAICLAYTGLADDAAATLLAYLGNLDFAYTPWVWDDLQKMSKAAWLYMANLDVLLASQTFHPIECLTEAALRVFPKDKILYKPQELSVTQKMVLDQIADTVPGIISSHELAALGLPANQEGLLRLCGRTDTLLDTCSGELPDDLKDAPLWYILELYLNSERLAEEDIVKVLYGKNVWGIVSEVFVPKADKCEYCTLSASRHFDNLNNVKNETSLIAVFANALYDKTDAMQQFLDEWLEKTEDFEGYDWSFRTPAQRIGIALLALARSGKLTARYYPLVRIYHKNHKFSPLPHKVIAELLAHTPSDHQQAIVGNLPLYTYEREDDTLMQIFKDKATWMLLKGCSGEWVTEKVRDAAEKWSGNKDYSPLNRSDAFPFKDAVEILKAQEKPDMELIYSLPRF